MDNLSKCLKEFRRKYPLSITWRIEKNANIIRKHLNEGEEVKFAFAAQNGGGGVNVFNTVIVAITNTRLLVGCKRVVFGYKFLSITPDLYNDFTVRNGLIWANITIDTVKEEITLTHIQCKATVEIETEISEFMIKEKRKYRLRPSENY